MYWSAEESADVPAALEDAVREGIVPLAGSAVILHEICAGVPAGGIGSTVSTVDFPWVLPLAS